MKRAVLFVVIALLGGLALGALFGSGMSSAAQAMARGATPAEAILAAAPSVPASPSAAVSTPGTQPPYSTVSDCDRVLLPQQVSSLESDEEIYTWGLEDGIGEPIRLTGTEYFDRYVYNADYASAPEQGVDEVLMQGNALENVLTAYPDDHFVEYHFPGLDESREGFDWCSLKVVLAPCEGDWYLVGLIHSEWTI